MIRNINDITFYLPSAKFITECAGIQLVAEYLSFEKACSADFLFFIIIIILFGGLVLTLIWLH